MLNWTYLEISEWYMFIAYKQKRPSFLSFKMMNIKFRVWFWFLFCYVLGFFFARLFICLFFVAGLK